MGKISRRQFIIRGGTTFVASAVGGLASESSASQDVATEQYPVVEICGFSEVKAMQPVRFFYPDAQSPCILLKLKRRVDLGIGSQGDIVAFSALCPHMGCGLEFNVKSKCMECACHFSIFDCESVGQMVCGQATTDLARIQIRLDPSTKRIQAVGIEGEIYGRLSNRLPVRGL